MEKINEIYNKIKESLIIKCFLIGFCCLVIILFFLIYKIINNQIDYEINNENFNDLIVNDESSIESKTEVRTIIVYITGEVMRPGIYEMNENSRISDLVEKAGGLTENASLAKVNLAYKIDDGQKITIPCINNEIVGDIINEDAGENVLEESESFGEKVNINTASISDFMKISGIGESTAQKIIEYRKNNGKFKTIEDIKNVSGIGESKYNQIKDYIKAK